MQTLFIISTDLPDKNLPNEGPEHQQPKGNFVSGAALSWKDEASFDGADVVDGDAEPEVRDDLHTAQVGGGAEACNTSS
jgi:hypothetical protein